MKFGKLEILSDLGTRLYSNQKKRFVLCRCDCGNIKEIPIGRIKNGQDNCGCERGRFKHGLWEKNYSLCNVWSSMISRCYNPKNRGYKYYGGRGISVCYEWKNDLEIFFDWAMKNGYKEGLTIDRINNDGNYEPSNIRFVTTKDNNRNSSGTKLSMDDVLDIRSAYLLGCSTQKEIARGFHVSTGTINQIILNRTWQ
jgi:hypothetical protein